MQQPYKSGNAASVQKEQSSAAVGVSLQPFWRPAIVSKYIQDLLVIPLQRLLDVIKLTHNSAKNPPEDPPVKQNKTPGCCPSRAPAAGGFFWASIVGRLLASLCVSSRLAHLKRPGDSGLVLLTGGHLQACLVLAAWNAPKSIPCTSQTTPLLKRAAMR